MNKIVWLLAAMLVLHACQETTPQNSTGEEETSTDSATAPESAPFSLTTIEDIRTLYAQIVQRKEKGNYTLSSFEYDCQGEKAGTVAYYQDATGIQLIEHQSSEYSHYGSTEQYFVYQGRPFFIYFEGASWIFDVEAELEGATRDDITEQRFYILNGELAQCLQKEFTIRSASSNNPVSAEVPNQKVNCPPIQELTDQFERLMKYKNQKEDMECLE